MEHSTQPHPNDNTMQNNHPELYGKGVQINGDMLSEDQDHDIDANATDEKQAGVQRIEAVSKSWTKGSLYLAYATLLLIATVTSLEIQVTSLLVPYATSAFKQHSLLSTVTVVQGIISAVIKPPMSKIADVFGRLESFTITMFLYTIGYILQASSQNVQTFAGAQTFWSAGFQGLQVLQQIFVADTSTLLNRALFSSLFDLPFLWTVWAGPAIGQRLLKTISWRWGYAVWAIILPICFIPLLLGLWMSERRAKKNGLMVPYQFQRQSTTQIVMNLWYDLDVFGLLLITAGVSLILLPLTLAPLAKGHWSNASMIAMLVLGGVFLVLFPFWETSKKLAPKAFFPPHLFTDRTVIAGCLIAFFYFMAFYMSVFPYFYSYLVIVPHQSIVAAGNITRVFSFTSTIASVVVSLFIKFSGHYKYFITAGAASYILGFALMVAFRGVNAPVATFVGTQILIGVGGGFINVPVQLGVQASVSHQHVASVTAVWLTIVEVGGAVGTAVSGALWSTYIPIKLEQYLPAGVDPVPIFANVVVSSNYTLYPSESPERIAINRAYQETMRYLLIGAICAAAPILPLSLCMKNYKLASMKQPVEGRVFGGTVEEGEERKD